jgi:hypothetical protein
VKINESAALAAGWKKVGHIWYAPQALKEAERVELQETTRRHYRKLGLDESSAAKAAEIEQDLIRGFQALGLSAEESRLAARGPDTSLNGSSGAFGSSMEDLLEPYKQKLR